MSNSVEDLQVLRLIKAFQKITDQDTRRMIISFVEQHVPKQRSEKPEDHPDGR